MEVIYTENNQSYVTSQGSLFISNSTFYTIEHVNPKVTILSPMEDYIQLPILELFWLSDTRKNFSFQWSECITFPPWNFKYTPCDRGVVELLRIPRSEKPWNALVCILNPAWDSQSISHAGIDFPTHIFLTPESWFTRKIRYFFSATLKIFTPWENTLFDLFSMHYPACEIGYSHRIFSVCTYTFSFEILVYFSGTGFLGVLLIRDSYILFGNGIFKCI